MSILNFNEAKLKQIVKLYLLKCRNGDWRHALRMVKWIKKLGKGRKDFPLLIIAGYLHDIGWYNILPRGRITLKKVQEYEGEANKNSLGMVHKILKPLGYSHYQISKINHLIATADKHFAEKGNEEIIVDADNLSKLNINHLKEKFKKSEWLKVINFWEKEFLSRIKTELGKKIYPKLLSELKSKVLN